MTDTHETTNSTTPAPPSGVEMTYVGPQQPPYFVSFVPPVVSALSPEAHRALGWLSQLPFAVRVIVDHPPVLVDDDDNLIEDDFDMQKDLEEILIELDRHVIAHAMEEAPPGRSPLERTPSSRPSLVAVHVVRKPERPEYKGWPQCLYSWWYADGLPRTTSLVNERFLNEAVCSYCRPELLGEGGAEAIEAWRSEALGEADAEAAKAWRSGLLGEGRAEAIEAWRSGEPHWRS
jgi:hypothetical protein